jgi:hypothetical protein
MLQIVLKLFDALFWHEACFSLANVGQAFQPANLFDRLESLPHHNFRIMEDLK